MKTILRKSIHLLGNLLRFIHLSFLRLSGAEIGKNTMISLGAKLDLRRGKVVIGDNCLITHGCYILSHDGAAHVLNEKDNGEGKVIIGNDVFIGVNTVVLRNVTIGNHAIIGAGSVVNKMCRPVGWLPVPSINVIERNSKTLIKLYRKSIESNILTY